MTKEHKDVPSPNTSDSVFEAPIAPAEGSALREVIDSEKLAFEQNNLDQDQRRKHDNEIHGMRKWHAWLLFGLTVGWITFLWVALLLEGFGQWFFPIPDAYVYLKFKVSDSVMIAFMTTTTTTVLGLYGIAAYWLYGKPKTSEAKPPVKKEKKSS
jgi:polyferredoxin